MRVLRKQQPEARATSPRQEDEASISLAALQAHLVSTLDGLDQAEAQRRLARYGANELVEKRSNPFLQLLASFWGPIPWMIEVAAILSLLVRYWADFGIIVILLVVNALVDFWEEYQASNTIAALKARLAIQAQVKRDGAWTTLPARELVPGDIIHLRLGEIVPADARLLEGDPVEVDQSVLTGESLPAVRKAGENVYSGSRSCSLSGKTKLLCWHHLKWVFSSCNSPPVQMGRENV